MITCTTRFFFSSRRRHTRFSRDWSSDVVLFRSAVVKILSLRFKNLNSLKGEWKIDFTREPFASNGLFAITGPTGAGKTTQIGRASCRERGNIGLLAGAS